MAGESKGIQSVRYPGLAILFPAWNVIAVLAYGRHYLQGGHAAAGARVLPDLLGWLGCYYPWILLTPLIFRLERRYPLGTARWPRHAGMLALYSLPISYGASMLMITLSRGARMMLGALPWHAYPWWQFSLAEVLIAETLFWCTVLAGYVIRNLIQLHDQERTAAQLALEKSQLETVLRQAELEALRARLNPHFLFNTLQNISVLTQQDPKTASRMLVRLGDLLRVVLRRNAQPETTLEAEFELTQAYVALEKMRFGDRLHVEFEAGPETAKALVPTFLFQPLVENAIVHGLKGTQQNGIIGVRGVKSGNELVLTVTDNGIGPPAEDLSAMKIGIGLGSTGERLTRMYPGEHSLSMRRLPEGGTEVRIAIPLRYGEAPVHATMANEYAPLVNR